MKIYKNPLVCFVGILFCATLLYAGEACFIYPPGSANRPAKCNPWSGCTQSDAQGRCTGYFHVNIDDVTQAYAAMSCNNATASTYNKCMPYPETKCVNDGAQMLTCLSWTAWTNFNCTGESGTMSIIGQKCKTKF